MSYHEKIKRGTTGQRWQFLMVGLLSVFFFVGLSGVVSAATQWVSDPATCNMLDATNFPGQNCDPDRICGDSSGIAQCYNTASLLPPAVSATSNTLYSASYPNGGYILNCYAAKDSAAPFCDNNGAYWCNRSNTCYTTQQRDTTCTANTWATATCGSCRTGYGDCDLDGGGCEVQYNVTNYPSGTNNHYGTTCDLGDVRCDSGYYDCDATGVAVGNGCEALLSGTCTTGGGLDGTWSCSVDAGGSCTDGGSNYTCTCVPPKQYFETGTKAQYGTVDPLLWGVQFGAGDLIHFGNSSNSDLFVVKNDGSVNLGQIAVPADPTDSLYNIAGSLYWNGTMIGAGPSGSAWSLTGNASTDPSVNFIGTTDYQPIVFQTDSSEWMRLTEEGYLGIGTDAPEQGLSVKYDVLIGQNEDMIIPAGGIDRNLYLRARDGSLPGNQGTTNIVFQRNLDNLARISVNQSNTLLFQPYNVTWNNGMAMTNAGNVGIGINNPHSKLDIGEGMIATPSGDTSILLTQDGGDTFLETSSTDMAEGLLMHGINIGDAFDYGVIRNYASSGYALGWERGLHIFSGDDGANPDPIIFSIDGSEVVRMTDDGYVGIGTDSPSAPFHVYGNTTNSEIARFASPDVPNGFAFGYDMHGGETGLYEMNYGSLLVGTKIGSPNVIMVGQQAIYIDYLTKNVGIGNNNDSLQFPLHVYADSGINTYFNNGDSLRGGVYIGNGGMYSGDEAGLYDAGGDYPLAVYDASNDTVKLGHQITVDVNTGFIGMNESSPLAQLEITDFSSVDFEPLLLLSHGGAGQSVGLLPVGEDPDGTVTAPRGSLAMDYANGMLYINRDGLTDWQSLMVSSSVWDGDADTGMQVEETLDDDYIRFDTAGSERMVITNEGAVQIGSGGHLSASLSVNGIPGLAGIAGYRDQNGEDIFSAIGNLASNNFQFLIGDAGGAYPNSYGGITGLQLNQAAEALSFGRMQLRLLSNGGSDNYIGFLAPAGVVGQTIWTLPAADGTAGQALVTDGAGTLSWASGGSGWSLTGNAGTNPITNFLGTTDNQALVFRTNNTEQVRITNTGEVGIGTNAPGAYKLNVQGNGYFSISEDFNAFMVYNSPKDSVQFRVDGDLDNVILQENSGRVGIGIGNPNSSLHVFSNNTGEISRFANADMPRGFGFGTDLIGGEAGLYEYVNGMLLVGTQMNDANKLMLGYGLAYGDLTRNNFSIGTEDVSTHRLLVRGHDNLGDDLFKVMDGVDGAYLSIYVPADGSRDSTIEWQRELRFHVGTTDRQAMVISNYGYVGIGVADPAATLDIKDDYGLAGGFALKVENSAGTENELAYFVNYGNAPGILIRNVGNPNGAALTVDEGRVGFGTAVPEQQLTTTENLLVGQLRDGTSPGIFGLDRNLYVRSYDGSFSGTQGAANLVFQRNASSVTTDIARVGIDVSNNILLQHWSGSAWVSGVTVKNNQYVGLGVANPSSHLHINNANSDEDWITMTGNNIGNLKMGYIANQSVIEYNNSDDGTGFGFQSFGNDVMYLSGSGNVAIGGGTAPTSKLEISGDNTTDKVSLLRLFNPQNEEAQNSEIFFAAGGGNGTYWNVNAGGGGGALIMLDGESKELAKFTSSGLVINDGGITNVGLRVEGDTQVNLLYTDATNDRVGIGTNTPGLRFHVVQASNAVAAFDRTGNDGTIISIRQDGVEEGTISVSGNTVSYNAFTGSHYTWHEGTIEKGMLVSMTGKNKRLNDNEKSEVLYGVEVSKQINSPKVLGSYLSVLESQQEQSTTNPALVMAVGNGELWVADKGENIEAGDYLISSDVAGHAQKMDTDYALNYVVARAAEDIDWSQVTETVDGVKHQMITVFFDSLVVNTQMVDVIKSNHLLGSQLNFAKMDKKDADKVKKQLGGEISTGGNASVGAMQVGQATIPGKNASVRVSFANAYSSPPIVMLTLASDSSLMRYFVSNVTESGFTLNLYPSQYQDTLFNWQAYPASGVQSTDIVSEPILEDLPEYEVPVIVPPQDDFLPIVPDKEDNTLNLNGAEDVLYNSGLSIVEVGDGLGDEIADTEDVSDEVSNDDILVEVIETPSIIEEPVAPVEEPEPPIEEPVAPVTPEITEAPAENLE